MKMKYWLPMLSVLFVIILLLMTGCIQITVQTTPIPPTTLTVTTTTASVPTITAPYVQNLIQQNRNNPEFVIVDVRTAGEFNTGHISGAVNIDYTSAQFASDVSLLDKSKQYLIYCQTGVRGRGCDPNNDRTWIQQCSKHGRRHYGLDSGWISCQWRPRLHKQPPHRRNRWMACNFKSP